MTDLLDNIGLTVSTAGIPPLSRRARWFLRVPRWLRWAFPGWELVYLEDQARRCLWLMDEVMTAASEEVCDD